MVFLIAWLVCSVSGFYLLRNYVSSNLRLVGIPDAGIATAMRNAAKKDDSIEEMKGAPDNVLCALFCTISLVICLVVWPMVLASLVWWKINKQDFSIFRG